MYRKSLKIGAFLVITGCAGLSKPDVKSDWKALQEAKSLDCVELPLLPEDLRIDRVHVVDSTGPSLFLEVTSRKGMRTFYHLAFGKKSQISASKLVKLPVSQDAKFLGAGIVGTKAVFVVHSLVQGKPHFQVRDLTNNVLLHQFATKIQNFELGDWVVDAEKLAVLLREDKIDEATDDQPYLELTIPLTSEKGFSQYKSKVIGNRAEIIADAGGKRFTIALDRGTSTATKEGKLRINSWNAGKALPVDLEEKGPIESWDALRSSRDLSLAYVKGNSLLDESTSLEAYSHSLNEPFSKQISSSIPLSRVHVAQPLLAGNALQTMLFVPQWLDHELTVGAYKFTGSELLPLGFVGIFKEGTAFEKAFFHEPSEAFYLLSRYYSTALAKYSLCEVES